MGRDREDGLSGGDVGWGRSAASHGSYQVNALINWCGTDNPTASYRAMFFDFAAILRACIVNLRFQTGNLAGYVWESFDVDCFVRFAGDRYSYELALACAVL